MDIIENKTNKILKKEVTTPAGNKFTIRKIKVRDEDIITDDELSKKGECIPQFVMSITGMSRDTYNKLLQGEIFYILIQTRIFSKGSLYETRIRNKGKMIDVTIDLEKDLYLQKLNKTLSNENHEFELTLPVSGDRITGKLLTGKDDSKIYNAAMQYPNQASSLNLMLRTKSINGKPVTGIEYFENMDSDDADFLRDEYERRDCGYDTDVTVYDRIHHEEIEIAIPFDLNFFFGKKKKRKKKRR